jgi:hypothetical protein
MKIQQSQGAQVLPATELRKAGSFTGRTMSALPASSSQSPLSVLLRRSVTLNKVQELALERLQLGEHTPLTERRIRVL